MTESRRDRAARRGRRRGRSGCRRAEYYGLRGAVLGAAGRRWSLLLLKEPLGRLGARRSPAACCVARRARRARRRGLAQAHAVADAARLADRACGLQDRVATALEWADRAGSHAARGRAGRRRRRARRAGWSRASRSRRVIPREASSLPSRCALALVPGAGAADPAAVGAAADFSVRQRGGRSRAARGLEPCWRTASTPPAKDPAQAPVLRGARLRPAPGGTGAAMSRRPVGHLQGHRAVGRSGPTSRASSRRVTSG